MLDREALDYLVQLGVDEQKVTEIDGRPYTHMNLKRVTEPQPEAIILHTLRSLMEFIKELKDKNVKLIVHVESHDTVKLYGHLKEDASRDLYAVVRAITPREIEYGRFYGVEEFNISLQAKFIENDDRNSLLKYTGLIKEDKVKETGDDGVSQMVTIKTGVASVGNALVPNPVTLAPWRTFIEVDQPESKFIFRMKDGPAAALFEADGGAWKLEAVNRIGAFLYKNLPEGITLLV